MLVLRYRSGSDVFSGNFKSNDHSAFATYFARYNSQPPVVTCWISTWAPIKSNMGKLYGTTLLSSLHHLWYSILMPLSSGLSLSSMSKGKPYLQWSSTFPPGPLKNLSGTQVPWIWNFLTYERQASVNWSSMSSFQGNSAMTASSEIVSGSHQTKIWTCKAPCRWYPTLYQ